MVRRAHHINCRDPCIEIGILKDIHQGSIPPASNYVSNRGAVWHAVEYVAGRLPRLAAVGGAGEVYRLGGGTRIRIKGDAVPDKISKLRVCGIGGHRFLVIEEIRVGIADDDG